MAQSPCLRHLTTLLSGLQPANALALPVAVWPHPRVTPDVGSPVCLFSATLILLPLCLDFRLIKTRDSHVQINGQ